MLGHSFDREDVSTVGGLVLAEFGRVPRVGEIDRRRRATDWWSSTLSAAGCRRIAVHRQPLEANVVSEKAGR